MSNKNRKTVYSALLIGILLVLYLLFGRKENAPVHRGKAAGRKYAADRMDLREAAFRHRRIYYTKHAKCRMECREIDESEVREVLQEGKINYTKSNLKDKPCPTYAVEGITHDRQRVRIVVGDCASQASIVTVIDLENDFRCECE